MANYGYAPYEEAAVRGQARMSTLQRLGQLFAGAGQGIAASRGAANPLEAGLLGFSGSYGASNAARQAAEQYAMKQIEAERAAEERQQRMAFMEAQIERMKRPEKPEKQEKPEPWQLPPEDYARYLKYEEDLAKARAAGRPATTEKGPAKGAPAQRPKVVTGAERQALAYYNRAQAAEDTIKQIENDITKLDPVQQFRLQFAPNIAQTPTMQVYRQSQRAFTEARLRKESGAAIPPAEYENDARTYFAQPGDSPKTVAAKRAARQVVLNGLKFSSGRAYDEFYKGAEVETAPDLIYNHETGELEPAR